MTITVRTKKISKGRLSLYLDYYPAVKKEDGRFTRRESLNRYLFEKPKNEEEKRYNKENKTYAESVRLKRERAILNEKDDIFNSQNKKRDFLQFFKQLTESRFDSKGNHDNWLSAYQYLSVFTGGKCIMSDIDEDFCNNFKEYLLKTDQLNTVKGLKLSQNSAHSYFNKFRAAVNEAYEKRYFNENPFKHVKAIPSKQTIREFLTLEELTKLEKTECEIPILKTAALFSARTGLRWSDFSKLKWKDIRHTKDKGFFVHIMQTKTNDSMMHPINNKSVETLGERGGENDYVFHGLEYSDNNNDKLKRWIWKAGIEKKITLHNFRHSYATIMLNLGADILTVSKMLGHKNIKTTMLYAKVLDNTKIAAANLIEF